MCGFCTAAVLKDDCGEDGFGTVTADVTEIGNTIPGDITTTETIAIGETRQESLEVAGDSDWFSITLEEGEAIRINLDGVDHDAGNGLDAVPDTFLSFYDSEGNLLAQNDDRGIFNRNSELEILASESGTFYIEATSFEGASAGDYELAVEEIAPPTPLDAIRGSKSLNDDETILVYFAEAGDEYRSFGDLYIASGTNAYEEGQLFSVFEGVEEFADIDFEITTDREAADLEVATATLPSDPSGTLLGFFNFPTSDGEGRFGVLNNNNPDFPEWNDTPGGTLDTGGFMYGVAIHEFGHGMGLGHPHDTGNGSDVMQGVSSSADSGDFNLNMAAYTAMSYVEGSELAGAASSTAATGHGATFGALDIAVLQEYYGVNTTHAGGDDVYLLDDTNDVGSGAGYYATWDTGGEDEFRYDGSSDATIDLRDATLQYETGGGGFLSYVDGVIGGRTIANGVTIENARGGTGNDEVTGNDGANLIGTRAGNDTVEGLAGDDRIAGGSGRDMLNGGDDDDIVVGGGGRDTVSGGDGDDVLRGKGGDDIINGGEGDDRVQGNGGDDTFVFSGGLDVIVDYDTVGDLERIDLSGFAEFEDYDDLVANHMSQVNSNVVIDDLAGNVLTIRNTDVGAIDPIEFIFAIA